MPNPDPEIRRRVGQWLELANDDLGMARNVRDHVQTELRLFGMELKE